MIFIIVVLVITIVFGLWSSSLWAATYYLDAVDGNDNNPGTSEQPWQTLSKSKATVTSGNTIYLRTGNYGSYGESLSDDRTDWIIYKAESGEEPVFTKISVYSSSSGTKRNAYLKFDGIDIEHPNWEPESGDDGDYHGDDAGAPKDLFYFKDVNYVQLLNGKYEGYYRWISLGGYIKNIENVTIRHCEITNVNGHLLDIEYPTNVLIDNCYLHRMLNGSGIRILYTASDVTIQNNHIYFETDCGSCVNDPYFPHWFCPWDPNWDGETDSFLHNGSGISARSSNIVIRKNIIRGNWPQSLMFYNNFGPYMNMVVENNLFYDADNIMFYDLGENNSFRNNTLIGRVSVDGTAKPYILQRYKDYMSLGIQIEDGYDGSKTHIYNNIMICQWGASEGWSLDEDYNITWNYGGTNGYQYSKGDHTLVVVYEPETGYMGGYPNFFEDIGYRSSTDKYSYSEDGIQPFFVNPGFYFGEIGDYKDKYKIWDYHLAEDSPGINFGVSTVATYSQVFSGEVEGPSQPPDSLGSLGGDGFIVDNGPTRDASHHSVGAYEYQIGTKYLLAIKE